MGVRVGFVVVSHSPALGEAVRLLATEMVPAGAVPIEVAAGVDDEDGVATFGTDALAISEAMSRVASAVEEVVVLMDLGSAILSAELALELVDDDVRARVRLCPAALVEGLVVGAVAAAGGADASVAMAEATRSLSAKASHFEEPVAPSDIRADTAEPQATGSFELSLPHGLHARPVARLVAALADLEAQVWLIDATTGSAAVPADSPTAIAGMGAAQGHRVEVRADGAQAQEAVERVLALAASGFADGPTGRLHYETEKSRGGAVTNLGSRGHPVSESGGPGKRVGAAVQAIAQVWHVTAPAISASAGDAEHESARLDRARAATADRIRGVRDSARDGLGDDAAAIFEAHLSLLDDSHLLQQVRAHIAGGAAGAWQEAVTAVERQLSGLEDPYLRARSADLRAVGDQVLRALAGEPEPVPDADGILIARDLTPAQVLAAGAGVVGVLLSDGSAVSHAAILARQRGLPWVCGAGSGVLDLDGQVLRLCDDGWSVT